VHRGRCLEIPKQLPERYAKALGQQADIFQARLHVTVLDGRERFLLHVDPVAEFKLRDALLTPNLPDAFAETLTDVVPAMVQDVFDIPTESALLSMPV
jgi:hypothetical protein